MATLPIVAPLSYVAIVAAYRRAALMRAAASSPKAVCQAGVYAHDPGCNGVNGGAITMYPTGGGPAAAYGTFFSSINSGFVTGAFATIPPLVGDTIDVCCNSPGTPGGTLVVWMTATGNLASNVPIPQMFESSFTENLLPDGWTVQVDTFLDPANGIFTTTIPLSSHLFRGSDPVFHQTVRADPGNGLYSVTERFTITASSVVGVQHHR